MANLNIQSTSLVSSSNDLCREDEYLVGKGCALLAYVLNCMLCGALCAMLKCELSLLVTQSLLHRLCPEERWETESTTKMFSLLNLSQQILMDFSNTRTSGWLSLVLAKGLSGMGSVVVVDSWFCKGQGGGRKRVKLQNDSTLLKARAKIKDDSFEKPLGDVAGVIWWVLFPTFDCRIVLW